jgi:hypothetical protein
MQAIHFSPYTIKYGEQSWHVLPKRRRQLKKLQGVTVNHNINSSVLRTSKVIQIETIFKEIGSEYLDWVQLAQT